MYSSKFNIFRAMNLSDTVWKQMPGEIPEKAVKSNEYAFLAVKNVYSNISMNKCNLEKRTLSKSPFHPQF